MNTSNAAVAKAPTHIARIGTDSIQFHGDDYETAVADFVATHGGVVPQIEKLVAAFDDDESAAGVNESKTVTRAGLVNAFTRYAHASGDLDVFDAFEVERAASKLLRPGSSIPFVSLADA